MTFFLSCLKCYRDVIERCLSGLTIYSPDGVVANWRAIMPEEPTQRLTLFFVAGGRYLVDRSGYCYSAPFSSVNYTCGCGKTFDAGESFKQNGYNKNPGGWVLGSKWFCDDCVEIVRWNTLLSAYDGMVEIAEAYGIKIGGLVAADYIVKLENEKKTACIINNPIKILHCPRCGVMTAHNREGCLRCLAECYDQEGGAS